MDRRKKLATAGAVSLTATAAVVALGASVGLFGLTDTSSRVGKLSPIDATHATTSTTPEVQTIIVDDPPASPGATSSEGRSGSDSDARSNTTQDTSPRAENNAPTTVNSVPGVKDLSDDRGSDDPDHLAPGSTSAERDHDQDD
jgi:hypothetical protein